MFFYIHLFGRWEQKWGKPTSQHRNWSYLWLGSPVSCTVEWASGESFVAMFDLIRWPPGSELLLRTPLILHGCSNQQVCRGELVVLNWKFKNYLLTNIFLLIFAPHSAPLLLFWTAMWSSLKMFQWLWSSSPGLGGQWMPWRGTHVLYYNNIRGNKLSYIDAIT